MNSKALKLFFGILMSLFANCIWSQQPAAANQTVLLINAKTNKSINVSSKYDPDKVEAILGKSITLDKEILEQGEEPIYTFHYDGLIIEMQNNAILQLTITKNKWKLNKFTIGTLIEEIAAKHEKHDAKFVYDHRFKIKGSKGVIFAEMDNLQRITKLGVVFNK
ncbi:hypothetical protein NAT51_00185 [Flavobacterium amniphilum]|uniref:hypothetical protein n=1 Tax=Flavobacterium amniphilum TaxID=1834035 RepID=UPI00202A52BE|nr:hypothetical protein [Flavobacterium amniphilum]MCL9803921.1 hypothetical protein [Flavobacterium amniphilum]